MRVAIVGAGAGGLVTAHLLDRHHEVTLYEASPVVGGTIRTLGGNVAAPPGLAHRFDTGVIELEATLFPTVMRLLQRLGVATEPVPVSTTYCLEDGQRLLPRALMARGGLGATERLRAFSAGLACYRRLHRLTRPTRSARDVLARHTTGELLRETPHDRWLALLAMYAWSTPLPDVAAMPAALTLPTLRAFTKAEGWVRIPGGIYTYVHAILDRFGGRLWSGSPVQRIHRGGGGLTVDARGRPRERYDVVVIATPPHRVLPLLAEPSPVEYARFEGWRGRTIRTVLHDDPGPYARRGATFATEFDLFALPGGRGGYNALLDRLCGLTDCDAPGYGLAMDLDDEIDPARILHVQEHDVPVYTLAPFQRRDEVLAHNGAGGLWFVGAWLGDGLHEGAVSSAARVAAALGGDVI